ncbi:thiolase family protein [Nakamurella aerolata]|uniref:Probable acetyl-CoA acetyltransferase n=1 Tax=Nakamurella aerolata TaxID=1656892 RepID=A0A849A807_9ACTN|nr:acetyl-CoA C-acyltransferase [Nakamurella aerolata]NNG37114.1 acetyl-CoA C-acyltransferase [Nakamurella aerolata]
MSHAFLIDGVRTPIGRYGGALAPVRPDDLAALVISHLVERSGVDPDAIDEVVFGAANQAGEDNRNVARMATLLAGLPDTVPGFTVNRLCASGLTAVSTAAAMVASGQADVVLAGGVESMSRAPWVMAKPEKAFARPGEVADTSIGWRLTNPRFADIDGGEATLSMPETAEKVARLDGISRDDSDAFALRSHRLAVKADFAAETVPVTIPGRRGNTVVTMDEGPRPDTSAEALAGLRPVVSGGNVVTAGNASSLNDGAAAVLVASESAVRRLGLTPRARVAAAATAGVAPSVMGLGPVPATQKALARTGWDLSDVGAVELNEAFAPQALACIRRLGLDEGTVNTKGGAIALGHPLGCSGTRLLVTLLGRMADDGITRGLATLCVGVGQGAAMLVEAA